MPHYHYNAHHHSHACCKFAVHSLPKKNYLKDAPWITRFLSFSWNGFHIFYQLLKKAKKDILNRMGQFRTGKRKQNRRARVRERGGNIEANYVYG
jgi:hypothetical protein